MCLTTWTVLNLLARAHVDILTSRARRNEEVGGIRQLIIRANSRVIRELEVKASAYCEFQYIPYITDISVKCTFSEADKSGKFKRARDQGQRML